MRMFGSLEDTAIEKERRRLLKDVTDYLDSGTLRKGFTRELWDYMESLTLAMLDRGDDFFARFTGKMEKRVSWSIKWPLSTVLSGKGFILNVNPIIFLFQREEEASALIKHEIMHIVLHHHEREKVLKNDYSKLSINLGLDIAVNQYLKNLPAFCQRLSSVNLALNLDMKLNETLEYYVSEIDRAFREDARLIAKYDARNHIDYKEVHDDWSSGEDLTKDYSKEAFRGIMEYSLKGGTPEELRSLFSGDLKGRISWVNIIKGQISVSPSGRRKTVTRRNRRQPERLDLKGELRNHIPEVIVAIDISGSITDDDVRSYVGEILNLIRSYRKGIRLILCDDRIVDDYEVGSLKDLRKLTDRRGGTRFSPVFELLRKEGRNSCLLIYFTDGAGEDTLTVRPHHNTVFVVTGKELSVKSPKMRAVYINEEKRKENHTFGLEAMRELLHEWAR